MNKANTMNDSDKVQVWTYTTRTRANEAFGAVGTKTTETVDFNRMVVDCHTTGTIEGEYINRRGSYKIHSVATPEGAAEYRRRDGYTRIA
jgi:hypothetical protein